MKKAATITLILAIATQSLHSANPTIEWTIETGPGADPPTGTINPNIIVTGETFTIRAKGADADGNLTNIYINRNGNPFAYTAATNGFGYISNNPSTETQPTTFTAWATDTSALSSSTIRLTVYPKAKLVGAFYEAWFFNGHPWNLTWGVGIVPAIGPYSSNSTTGGLHAARLRQLGVNFIAIDNSNNTIWGAGHPDTNYQIDSIFSNSKSVISGFGSTGIKAVIMLSIANSSNAIPNREQLLTQNYDTGTPYMYYPSIPSNAGDLFRAKVAQVYNDIAYDPNKYQYYEGKPLLLLYTTASGTIYGPDGLNHTPNGKLEGSDLNITIPGVMGSPNITDLFTIRWVGAFVSNSGNPAYVASTDSTIAKNGHWSWEDGYPQSWARTSTGWISDVFPEAVTVSAYTRAYGDSPLQGRASGVTFLNHWMRAFEVDPPIVMVHTWNEFSQSGDETSPEYSQSIEANSHFGADYENFLKLFNDFFRSQRLDVALYDTSGAQFFLYNRNNDFLASTTTDFDHQSIITMYRGAPVSTISGDFNRDGLWDIGLRNASDGSVAIRFGPRFSVSPSGDNPAELVASLDTGSNYIPFSADFNGDGFCDIGFYNAAASVFKFYTNNTMGYFNYSHQFTWNVGSSVQVCCSDINGDRIPDLVIRDTSTGAFTFGLSNDDMLNSVPSRVFSFSWASGAHYQAFCGDFSNDGASEIGIRDSSTGVFYFLQNSRTTTGSTWNFGSQSYFYGPSGVGYLPTVGDFR